MVCIYIPLNALYNIVLALAQTLIQCIYHSDSSTALRGNLGFSILNWHEKNLEWNFCGTNHHTDNEMAHRLLEAPLVTPLQVSIKKMKK